MSPVVSASLASANGLRHDCEKAAPHGFLTNGLRQDGEKWTCPGCGRVWVHVCDEAEGCAWYLR